MALQMTCPFCKKEFPYYNGDLDRKISALGQEVNSVNLELARIKAMPYYKQKELAGRRKVLVVRKAEINAKLGELKAIRKACDQQINQYELILFKEVIKDRYGESEYQKILAQVLDELKAYKASGLMRHEYTRSNAKANVTSINKL